MTVEHSHLYVALSSIFHVHETPVLTDYKPAARTRGTHSLRCIKRGKTYFKYSNFPALFFLLFTTITLGKTKEGTRHDYYALRAFSNLFLGFLLSRLLHYYYGALSISCSLSRLLHPDGL